LKERQLPGGCHSCHKNSRGRKSLCRTCSRRPN